MLSRIKGFFYVAPVAGPPAVPGHVRWGRVIGTVFVVVAIIWLVAGGWNLVTSWSSKLTTASATPPVALPTYNPYPTLTPYPTAVPPTATPMVVVPSATLSAVVTGPVGTGACAKHGTVAWQNDNLQSGALYGESPVGGLAEPCGVVAQTWTTSGGTERFVFYVPPFTVVWLSGHSGGTGWYFDPSQDIMANLNQQAAELLARDGARKTTIAVLPGQTFRLVTRIQSASAVSTPVPAVVAGAGKCDPNDAVGPAILEYGELGTNKPIVLKLNQGKTSPRYSGGCFAFDSQSALDARWLTHRQEFLAKNPGGQAIEK